MAEAIAMLSRWAKMILAMMKDMMRQQEVWGTTYKGINPLEV